MLSVNTCVIVRGVLTDNRGWRVGKGLSELQKAVLRLACENRERGQGGRVLADGSQIGTDVTYPQVLAGYFGWEAAGSRSRFYQFSKKEIGEKRYRSAMASLSRAFGRLEARGLIERTHSLMAAGWTGADLTDEGREVARRLLGRV